VKFFFVLRNADFFKLKNAWELSWGKVLLIRVSYREQIMRHGWSVTLTYCYRLYGHSAFSNRHAVLRKLEVWQQKRKFVEYQFNVIIWKLWKTWKDNNLTRKSSKSRNYTSSYKISGKALHHFTASSTTPVISSFAHSATATVHNLRPYGRMRPSIMKFAAVHM